MKYFASRYNSSLKIIKDYSYPTPFHLHLRSFFKADKKFGSKDRKAISEICYSYYRLGLLLENYSVEQGLLYASASLIGESNELSIQQWNELASTYDLRVSCDQSFEFIEEIKKSSSAFYKSGFVGPKYKSLNSADNIGFRPKVWALDHSVEYSTNDLCGSLELEEDVISVNIQIQDLSSQTICQKIRIDGQSMVWDVCSGAGGKTLNLLRRKTGSFYLSDKRSSIIANAKKRIIKHGYNADFAVLDASNNIQQLPFQNLAKDATFDAIIVDAPCSGSGTWFRTPENFKNFDYKSVRLYQKLQQDIVRNAFPYLKMGGSLYYLTCSVFKAENETNSSFFINSLDLNLNEEYFFNGLNSKSDSMYYAHFKKDV